jgi:serine/threonine protein phosphatase PrpC
LKLFGTKLFEDHSSTPDLLTLPLAERVNLQSWSAQSVGRTRSHMEDSAFTLAMQLYLPERPVTLGIFMVADGMGGHDNGEVASRIAIQVSAAVLTQTLIEPLRQGELLPSHQEVIAMMEDAFTQAQEQVLLNVSGGGTTLTMALLLEKHLYFGHIGDSRLYFRSSHADFQPLTQDHSLVRRLVDLGQISEIEALHHPQRNVLFRALGQTEGFKVDLGHLDIIEPSQLLICTDGLWGLADEEELLQVIKSESGIGNVAEQLCDLANNAGGTDNISVIFVEIR